MNSFRSTTFCRLLVILAVLLAALVPCSAQSSRDTSPAVVRGKIEALLGGYEHSPSPAEWSRLGPAATANLASSGLSYRLFTRGCGTTPWIPFLSR